MDLWAMFIINPMLNVLLFLYTLLFNNFTLTIVVFTILVRALTYPLTLQQQRSMKKTTELQQSAEWKKLQEKYAGNREQLAQAQMKLYQDAGINPLGGCLPTFIQLPILMGLYQVINLAMAATPIQLLDLSRHVYPFMSNVAGLVPLDNRFLWLNLGLPDPWFILPILVAGTTWLQSKVMTPPSADPQAAQMSQSMAITMPLMFGYMALNFASGLSIYFIVANVIGIAQYALTNPINWKSLLNFDLGLAPAAPAEPTKRKK
jgi:YidC/Oxa1 family membrane protein insertase